MRLLIATRNRHKVDEIKAILGKEHQYRTLDEFSKAPGVIEDAATFEGNATKKAVTLACWAADQRVPVDCVLADDSGLEVDALNGAPGVHSARFAALDSEAKGNSPDTENNAKLLRLLTKIPGQGRSARFRCVIAFTLVPSNRAVSASPVCEANEAELQTQLFSGACEGRIVDTARGAHGFGYDPLFVPNGFSETFAELGEEQKNRISHRSKALEQLKATLAA
jgi:XTP/dITP diphosphohydrolase